MVNSASIRILSQSPISKWHILTCREGYVTEETFESSLIVEFSESCDHKLGVHKLGVGNIVIASCLVDDKGYSKPTDMHSVEDIYERFNRHKIGKVDASELCKALFGLGFSISPVILDLLVSGFDKSGGKNRAIDKIGEATWYERQVDCSRHPRRSQCFCGENLIFTFCLLMMLLCFFFSLLLIVIVFVYHGLGCCHSKCNCLDVGDDDDAMLLKKRNFNGVFVCNELIHVTY